MIYSISVLKPPIPSSSIQLISCNSPQIHFSNPLHPLTTNPSSFHTPPIYRPISVSPSATAKTTAMATHPTPSITVESVPSPSIKLLFVEMGVGYDQHGQDATKAAMRACRDAISSNSVPAFRRGSIPGVSFEQMKLQIKLGVPQPLQSSLDIEKVKSVFPYGEIVHFEVVDGGLICSSGVHVEEMGDKNDDCYIVNAAVYVGY